MHTYSCIFIHASYFRLSIPVKMSHSIYQHVIFHTTCYQLKPYTKLNWPEIICLFGQCPPQEQWAFHEVQEHPNRSSDEKVMTFRSWRSHMTKLSHPGSLPHLPGQPFPDDSNTQCPLKGSGWKFDSMGFP